MIHWRRLTPWLMRAWPVLALVPVAACHAIALRAVPSDIVFINKLVGMSLQVLGGLLILYSVKKGMLEILSMHNFFQIENETFKLQ